MGYNSNFIDITDKKFGRLAAIRPIKRRDNSYNVIWLCLCDCGNTCHVSSAALRTGNTKSCGCLHRDLCAELGRAKKIHGMSGTLIFGIWADMIGRCENPNKKVYKNYGGRGITVCERWHKFENFYEDMGSCPKGLTLERRNNDGNYEPDNCYYATRKEQSNNRRNMRWFFAFNLKTGEWDEDNNQTEFAKRRGLNDGGNISMCLRGKRKTHKGWPFQRI